jgi:F5/8 type C domain-containing protein/parallel beta helix pectate lyase-like protein
MPSTVRVLAALVAALIVALVAAAPAPARTVARTAWEVDLGTPGNVSTVTVAWRRAGGGSYRVQTSLDGRRFRTAARVRARSGKPVRVGMGRTSARFVRLAGRRGRTPRLTVRATSAARRPPQRRRPPKPAQPPAPAPAPSPAPAAAPENTVAWKTGDLPAPLPPSTGTRRFVSLAGSDANPGTEARPWRSIQRALDLARPGDQIMVRGGTYAGTAAGPDRGDGLGPSVYASPQGAPGQPITIQPYPGEKATIAGFVSLPRAAWFRMTGFVIDGSTTPNAEGVSLGNTSSGAPHHVELSYNEIRDFQPAGTHAHGILHYSGTDTALIGNRIHHIGRQTFFDHGIYLKAGRRVVVANNVISDVTGGYGIHIWGDFDESWVIHNTVYGSAASGFTIGGNSDRGQPDRTVAANNIFAGHGATADSHQGYATKEYQPGMGNSVRRNLGWANARSTAFYLSASGPSANRTADPRFDSVTDRDLHVAAGGAAADAGEDFGLLLDADGRRRDGRPDIGAYEAR